MNRLFTHKDLHTTPEHECELAFQARPDSGVDEFFLGFVHDCQWDFSKSRYDRALRDKEFYKFSFPLSEKYIMSFTSRLRESVPDVRKYGFYIFEAYTRRPIVSIKGTENENGKQARSDCKIWVRNTSLAEAEVLARDWSENGGRITQKYGQLLTEVNTHCRNTIGKDMPHAA